MTDDRTILGLSSGNAGGSAEILLKASLQAAEEAGATVSLVRVDDLYLANGYGAETDDADWFWDQLMESDGLIVSTPIYSRTIPGKLRLLGDKISGPQADVAFTAELLRMKAEGVEIPVQFAIDERVLRPRVGGFIAVGGSLPPRWKSLAIPLMYTLTASMQLAIVDQIQFAGAGSPASILLDPDAIERARLLGRNVAAQLGRSYDAAEYVGDPGLCPLCHLDVIVVRADSVECASCGAIGSLVVRGTAVAIEFVAAGLEQSILRYAEKLDHFHEVQRTAAQQAEHAAEIAAGSREYAAWDRAVTPPRAASVDLPTPPG